MHILYHIIVIIFVAKRVYRTSARKKYETEGKERFWAAVVWAYLLKGAVLLREISVPLTPTELSKFNLDGNQI